MFNNLGCISTTAWLYAQISTAFTTILSIVLKNDSNIVLDWLSSSPRKWSTFVTSHTTDIFNLYQRRYWQHVLSKLNITDIAWCGQKFEELHDHNLWWNGPPLLSLSHEIWSIQRRTESTCEERRNQSEYSALTHNKPLPLRIPLLQMNIISAREHT